jgi:cytosine/adenosine deaminase-related metal-dependent hydrolase
MMKHAGIVAIGDISNTLLTYDIKKNNSIYYHTFVECFGFLRERAERAFNYGESLFDLFREAGLASSVCPHAPYSVSDQLFELIGRHAGSHNSILSFHHQESASENEFFLFKKGGLYNHLTKNLGFELDFWSAPGINATKASLSKIPKENQLLLVHNTFMTTNELSALQEIRSTGNTFLVTCPNANLYIESRLPDYRLWQSSGYPICIGTDSLASNHQLSIVEELKTIQQHQAIATEDILKWACTNGAKALKIDSWAGSLEKGKKPGINLISGVDWNTLFLTPRAKVKKIV